MNILEILKPHIDLKYKEFQQRICSSNYKILGVKIPILRKIAKDLLKNNDYQIILKNINNTYFEEIMLKALIISNAKTSYEEKITLIKNFLPQIDNWAICDIFCNELKFIKNNQDTFLKTLKEIKLNNQEFYQRFYVVIFLNYYIDDFYIDTTLQEMLTIKSDYYYVKMAVSWCLSICLTKYYHKTITFLKQNKEKIDRWTYNKALQKGCESLQISKENKDILRQMKIK